MNSTFFIIILVFILGYCMIAFEHPLKINKSATALLLGVILWTILIIAQEGAVLPELFAQYNADGDFVGHVTKHELLHHLGEISEILFFLLGAMTIVELIDTYGGFKIITDKIRTTSKVKFMWILSILAFFMSAVLDNMTTTIVMVTLLRKLVAEKEDRWLFASVIVIAANAGGAWSPIGDVTTIMLWVGGQVSAGNIIIKTFLASLVSLVVPLIILTITTKGHFSRPSGTIMIQVEELTMPRRVSFFILILGIGLLLCVPIFKTITHLPPYVGMLGALGILWVTTELINTKYIREEDDDTEHFKVSTIIRKIDTPSIMFFLGILLAVAALQVCGHLTLLSQSLDKINLADNSKYFLISGIIGVLSSIVDNVPLVAGVMGMYNFEMNHYFWEFLAYCAGTGGSLLIIGSAAGVAAMGLEKIDFIWYLKKISWLVLIGYLAGAVTFIAQYFIFHL
mgnify:CR=1 FL=1